MEEAAGDTMARFIEQYVRQPIRQISAFEGQLRDFSAKRKADGNIELLIGEVTKLITRSEDSSLDQGTNEPE